MEAAMTGEHEEWSPEEDGLQKKLQKVTLDYFEKMNKQLEGGLS
jgi:hypothetical protein